MLFDSGKTGETVRLHLSLSERKAFMKWITSMEEAFSARALGWEIRLPCEMACLLVEYSRAYQARGDGGRNEGAYPAYVRQALAVIDADYADCDLSVHRIAAQVGVSDDYLSRQFRQVTGITTQEYLRRYRFARAMSLLQTDCSIGEVAQRVTQALPLLLA
jgi:AraC-like DNA-binding protein